MISAQPLLLALVFSSEKHRSWRVEQEPLEIEGHSGEPFHADPKSTCFREEHRRADVQSCIPTLSCPRPGLRGLCRPSFPSGLVFLPQPSMPCLSPVWHPPCLCPASPCLLVWRVGLLASDESLLVTSGLLWGDRWPLNSVSMAVWYHFSCPSHGDFGVLVVFSLGAHKCFKKALSPGTQGDLS